MRRRIILAAAIAVLAGLAVWLVMVAKTPRQGIEFVISPIDATAKIDGQTYAVHSGQRLALPPGTYGAHLTVDGFSEDAQTVTVEEGKFVQLTASLDPQSEEAGELLSQSDEQQNRERVTGLQVSQGGQQLFKQYPWVDKLPITQEFAVASPCTPAGADESLGVCVRLFRDDQTVRTNMLAALKRAGVDPKAVTVQYKTSR